MRAPVQRARRGLPALAALLLAGCGSGPLAPSGAPTMADSVPVAILGFPLTGELGVGSTVLLHLDEAAEIREVEWISSAPEVASVTPTHGGSPCGTRCAWLAARAPGSAAIEACVCFVDSSCRHVDTARGCAAPTSELCRDLPPRLTVR